jgi:hypothetical protein
MGADAAALQGRELPGRCHHPLRYKPEMDINEVRVAFREFAGEVRFRKFVRAVSQRCHRKERLFFWQEQLWGNFVCTVPRAARCPDEILRAFRICDVHGCELEPTPTNDALAEIRDTPEYGQALETLFPLAAGRYFVCPRCRFERQQWISEHDELCRILRRQTTYEAFCELLLDGIADLKERECMKKEAKPRIESIAAEIAAQMQPGDELWEWDAGGWHSLSGRAGVAIVRAGKIVKKWCEIKS